MRGVLCLRTSANKSPYTPLAILATRNIALRFCRGATVGACKLAGRCLGGVAMAPLTSDIRESDRRGEFMSPCTDGGRPCEPKLEVDRDRDGPIGGRTVVWATLVSAFPPPRR
jgi:hypothetical protein